LNRRITRLSVLVAVFAIAGLGIQSSMLQVAAVSSSLSDCLVYEKIQVCVGHPSKNDSQTFSHSPVSRHFILENRSTDIHHVFAFVLSMSRPALPPLSLRC
jgi:hypothetical protein